VVAVAIPGHGAYSAHGGRVLNWRWESHPEQAPGVVNRHCTRRAADASRTIGGEAAPTGDMWLD
jgi:hypothetical protein